MIHGVAQDRTTLTEPLDLCPGLGGLAASVQIERNARLIFLTDSNDILFQVSRIAQGQGILGSSKGVLHLLCAVGSSQRKASPIALGFRGTIVGMRSQLLSGDRYVVNAACALGNDFSIIASCRVQLFVLVGVGLCIVVQLGRTNHRSRVLIHGQRHAGQVHREGRGFPNSSAVIGRPLNGDGSGGLVLCVKVEGHTIACTVGQSFHRVKFCIIRDRRTRHIFKLCCSFRSRQLKTDPIALGAGSVGMLSQLLSGDRYVVNAACALGGDGCLIAARSVQLFVFVSVGLCVVVELGGTDRRRRVLGHGQRHAGQVHMIHGVAQNRAVLIKPLDLCPGLESLASGVHIESNAGLVFDHIRFQLRRFTQGQRILGLAKGILHILCAFGSSQRKADPVALVAVRVGVLFQVLDGNCNLGVALTRLRFRCLGCVDVVAVLIIQSLDRGSRLVCQLCGVDRFRRSRSNRSRGRARVSCVALSRESSRGQQGQQHT